jgi:hypothetical protein
MRAMRPSWASGKAEPLVVCPSPGILCDQLLSSAADLPVRLMRPLLGCLAGLCRREVSSGIETTLMIYIQKQLWSTNPGLAGNAVRDDRRKLAGLLLAEALVLGRGAEDRAEDDAEAILTWVARTVPTAPPVVSSSWVGRG